MANYAHPELLAETDWLAAHLTDLNLRIVDCRYYYDGRVGRDAYLAGHIPGAVYMAHPTDLSDPTATPPNLAPRPEGVAATMGRLGIGNDTLVIGYDDEGAHTAARLWWVLAYYGHTKVKLLNGGIVKWLAEGRPIESGQVTPEPVVFRPCPPHADMRIRGDELKSELNDSRLGLLDVRRLTEYSGAEVRAARGGRIPGATHLLWQENLNADWTFRSAEEIQARHEAAGATPDQNVVTYCQSGIRAAHAAFSLRLIGYENVRMYDGSWNEWGNRSDLPIETGV